MALGAGLVARVRARVLSWRQAATGTLDSFCFFTPKGLNTKAKGERVPSAARASPWNLGTSSQVHTPPIIFRRAGILLAGWLLALAGTGGNLLAEEDKECSDCHSGQQEKAAKIVVPDTSIHADLDCEECHAGVKSPHPGKMPTVRCTGCHRDEAKAFNASSHSVKLKEHFTGKGETGDAASCLGCHGKDPHNIVAAGEDSAPTSRAHIVRTCLGCHEDRGDLDLDQYEQSVHGLAAGNGDTKSAVCTDCHGSHTIDHSTLPRSNVFELCGNCHKEESEKYQKSIHGIWRARGDENVATCTNCHGNAHRILPASDRKSQTNKFNLHKTCAACHQSESVLASHDIHQKEAVPQFVDSIHGRALLVDGLIVAPTCNDCHGVHDILPHTHPDSRISKDSIPGTCGKCHVLVEDVYEESVHGKLLKEHDSRGPVCNTCHTSHQIGKPSDPAFRLHSDQVCGSCHQDMLERYRETFHGKAIALGREGVAACYDCHGHHDIQETESPESRIHAERRVGTCKKCHPKANKNFADYVVHADHTDRENYPILYYTFLFMTALLLGTFAFFAVHTAFWLLRSMALYLSDSKEFRGMKDQMRADQRQYVRFRPVDRFLHGLTIASFLLLVVTGMPLKFYDTVWAKTMLSFIGGQAMAAMLHRAGAILMVFAFAVHVIEIVYGFFAGWEQFRDPETGRICFRRMLAHVFGPDSPMPNWQDAKDVLAHNLWFFGKGPKPQFDRWTYWEKFDYFAVFWGVAIIGASGLVMWFPELFTWVLPGWAINVAHIIHSDEALLAAGFIFTFHFFNVHFRPEKFPMDPVIFSGRISQSEMMHERGRQWERWEQTGGTEQHSVRQQDEWESWKWIALPAGFLAFCFGLLLVILIFYAMATRLMGG